MSTSTAVKSSQQPIRVTSYCNLSRLGDTLQSLMALKAAKLRLYPQMEIHFLARESFAAAAKRVPWIESVITFPTNALISPLLSGKTDKNEALSAAC